MTEMYKLTTQWGKQLWPCLTTPNNNNDPGTPNPLFTTPITKPNSWTELLLLTFLLRCNFSVALQIHNAAAQWRNYN